MTGPRTHRPTQRPAQRRALPLVALAWLLALPLLLAAALVLLPGPTLLLLAVSVAAAGQSLVLAAGGALVLLLCAGARAVRARHGSGHAGWPVAVPALMGVAVVVVGVLAAALAARTAADEGADVAWSGYLGGSAASAGRAPDATEVYATVDGTDLRADVWQPPGTADAGTADAGASGTGASGTGASGTGASGTGASGTGARAGRAVVRVHGGSWSGGQRSGTPAWDEELAAAGAVVVDVDYRLAPGSRWRAQAADVACALAWVGQEAARLGVDPARVAVMGESAGGHLALLAAYAPADPTPCGRPALVPEAVVALYPPTELVALERAGGWRYPDVLEGDGVLDLVGASPARAPAEYAAASPLTHVAPGAPRTLIVHGDHDEVVPVDQSRRLAAALGAAGVEHRYVELPLANHGFDLAWGGVNTQTARSAVAGWLSAG